MRKTIYLAIFFLATILPSNSQELLKEISKAFDNGQPMFIDYLETENLKKVKTEIFNETGKLIFSIKFNPDTGLPDGEFYDLINKGSFKEGVLNCLNCMLVEANSPSVYTYNHNKQNTKIIYGDVVKGRLVGEVKKYEQYEETYNKVDWNSTRRYVAAGAGIGFRDVKTYTTGKFTKTLVDTKVYNKNGVLDGTVNLSYTVGRYPNEVKVNARLSVKNGIIKSLVSHDEKGVQRDSVSNEQKIWKIDYKYKKSDDFVIFESNFESFVDIHSFNKIIVNNGTYYDYGNSLTDFVIPIGGIQNYFKIGKSDTGGPFTALDVDGIYSSRTLNKEYTPFIIDNPLKFLYIAYNYYCNNSILKWKLKGFSYNVQQPISVFIEEITRENTYNKFFKFLISEKNPNEIYKNLPWRDNKDKLIAEYDRYNMPKDSYVYPNDVNDYIISFLDFIKVAKEIIKNSEIQEIWVWNNVSNKYDKVDFDVLIELAEKKEKELQEKEDQKTKQMEAEQEEFLKKHPLSMKSLLEYSVDFDDFKNKFIKEFKDEIKEFRDIENWLNKLYNDYLKTLVTPLESDNKNLEFKNNKTKNYSELEFLKDLKLELTSEKSSEKYSSYISGIVKQYNKSYNLKIQDLEVYISQKNKNKEYYRYIFSNIEDLESLKKAFNQYAQPTYIDLDNKAPSIYYKK